MFPPRAPAVRAALNLARTHAYPRAHPNLTRAFATTLPKSAPYKLYSYAESGNSYKIRLFAALHDIPLEITELDFLPDQQHSPEYLGINPRGEVPALVDGQHAFVDSSSILVYLAAKHNTSYWSKDPAEQAAIVDWLAFANSWVQYGVFTVRAIRSFKGPYNGLGTTSTKQTYDEAKQRSETSLGILEQQLKDNKWLTLGRPTIGDISVFVYVALAPMGDVSLGPYPSVKRWIDDVKRLPKFFPIPGLDDPMYRRK